MLVKEEFLLRGSAVVELWLSVGRRLESGFYFHMIKGNLGLFVDIVHDV